jgi:hypothetical protein
MAAYKDGTTGREFNSKVEMLDYYIDLNSPFLDGDLAVSCKKRIEQRMTTETDKSKVDKLRSQLNKYEEVL